MLPTNCTEFRYLSVGIAFTLLQIPFCVDSIRLVNDAEIEKNFATALTFITVRKLGSEIFAWGEKF